MQRSGIPAPASLGCRRVEGKLFGHAAVVVELGGHVGVEKHQRQVLLTSLDRRGRRPADRTVGPRRYPTGHRRSAADRKHDTPLAQDRPVALADAVIADAGMATHHLDGPLAPRPLLGMATA